MLPKSWSPTSQIGLPDSESVTVFVLPHNWIGLGWDGPVQSYDGSNDDKKDRFISRRNQPESNQPCFATLRFGNIPYVYIMNITHIYNYIYNYIYIRTYDTHTHIYIYIPWASKPQKNDGFNWKHRVYTLYQLKTRVSIQTPGFLPSGSQAGIKRSKSWLDQTWRKPKKHEAAQVLSSPFIFPTTELSYPNRKKFGFEILRQLTHAQPVSNPWYTRANPWF